MKYKKAALSLAIICYPYFVNSAAFAQIEKATTVADPSRIENSLFKTDSLPQLSQKIDVQGSIAQNVPANAKNITFVLQELRIEGVNAYKSDDLTAHYSDKIGKKVSLADIYEISSGLTTQYRNDGYILTQVVVPPQTIENGIVALQVVEGFVDKIIIQGDGSEQVEPQIRKYADNLRVNNILDAKQMERYLLLINDLPGVSARGVLSPSQTTSGASDLTIIVEHDQYEAEIGFNNHGSRYLGPYQGTLNTSANSLFGHNERIGGQFVISGDKDRTDELLYGRLFFQMPISRYGTTLNISGAVTDTEPGYDLNQFDVKGQSKVIDIGVTHPFIRSRTTNFFGRAHFDARNVYSRNNLEPTRKDRIRSVRLGTTFQYIDSLLGAGINALDFQLSKGIGLFGASPRGSSELTRAEGNPKYTKLEGQYQRLQRITQSVNVLLSGQGQWAATPLLSSEEFGVGGFALGRGYDPSEIVGDDGVSGKIEVQWNQPKQIKYLTDYQLYAFWDAGRVWDQDATTSAGKRDSISSTGLGIRANIGEDTEAGFTVAFPLTRERDTTNDRDPRFYFNVSHKF